MSETTTTPNYGLIKPNVGADSDLWGDHWNSNADVIDSQLKSVSNKAGVVTWNTRSGAVSLNQADVTTVLPPGAGTPAMDGTATAGTLLTWSRSDHIHPTDTTRYAASNPAGYVTAAQATTAAPVQSVATRTGAVVLSHGDITDWNPTLAPYAPLASPALTGSPTAPTVTPTTDASTKLATTAFVQSALGAVPGGAIVSATPPVANPGALWFDSVGGQTYCRYDDGNTQQWVPVSNITGLANAAQLSDVAPAYNNVGRNLCHNSMFTIAQRGAGPWTTALSYTADRWAIWFSGGTLSTTVLSLSDADRASIGDEQATYALAHVFTGSATAGSSTQVYQRIENVRRLAGKTVMLSLWAWASTALKLGASVDQGFGTGGSPSATVSGTMQAVALTTTPTRYSLTFSVPSISGKTLGTNGDSSTTLNFYLSNQPNALVGVQSGTIQLWGVQLEIGSVATALEKPDIRYDLANCQRFFSSIIAVASGAYPTGGAGAAAAGLLSFPVTMRAGPTLTQGATITSTNIASLYLNTISASFGRVDIIQGAAPGNFTGIVYVTASADL